MEKVLVCDYDKTLYISDIGININKKYINNFINSGNIFVVATGRSYSSFHCKLDIYKFNYNYAILNHGATIIDNKNNVLSNISISNEIIPQLQNDLDLDRSIEHFCCSGIESKVNFTHKNLTKIKVKYSTKKIAFDKVYYINNKYGNYIKAYFVNTNSIEIISNKIDKSKAIYWLLTYLKNIDKNYVYTIGDSYNDIEMVKKFKGYCMKNSVPELKQISKGEYNSVADLIMEIMNNKI